MLGRWSQKQQIWLPFKINSTSTVLQKTEQFVSLYSLLSDKLPTMSAFVETLRTKFLFYKRLDLSRPRI